MRYSVVLFDLDGTLVDTNHLIIQSFQHTLHEKLGLDVSPEELYPYFGEPLVTTMERYSPERALELTDFYRVYNQANHDALVRQFVGVREMVQALHAAGVKLAVVTSKRRDMALRGLQVSGLDSFFATAVGIDDTEKHKPDPAPALLALSRLGVEAGPHVLMVGDSAFDILCGRGAGIETAAVGWTVQRRESLSEAGPDHWIDDPDNLTKLVLGKD